jgi:hypothetical protein
MIIPNGGVTVIVEVVTPVCRDLVVLGIMKLPRYIVTAIILTEKDSVMVGVGKRPPFNPCALDPIPRDRRTGYLGQVIAG